MILREMAPILKYAIYAAWLLVTVGGGWWVLWGKGGLLPEKKEGTAYNAPGGTINVGTTTTINNYTISPEQLRMSIDSKAETAKPDFEKRYPEGYVLFGKAEGQVIYKPSSGTVKLSADWDKTEILHDVKRRLIQVQVFESVITWGASRIRIGELISMLPFEEGKPIRIRAYNIGGISMYCEIVDIKNGVFLIGQRKE